MTDQTPPPPPPAATPGPAGMAPKHPATTTVLALGILGLVLCQILGPFAWIKGNNALAEIRSNPGQWSGENEINIGRILGIVASIFLIIGIAIFAFIIFTAGLAGLAGVE